MKTIFFLLLLIPFSMFCQSSSNSTKAVSDIHQKIDSLIIEGEFKEAIDHLSILIENEDPEADLYYNRGLLRSRTQPDDTTYMKDFELAIQINPDHRDAHYELGIEYYDLVGGKNRNAFWKWQDIEKSSKKAEADIAIWHFREVLRVDSNAYYYVRELLFKLYNVKGMPETAQWYLTYQYKMPDETDSLNIPIHHNAYYFPIEYLTDTVNTYVEYTDLADEEFHRSGGAHFSNAWYSRHLFALREPLVYNLTDDREIYRFTWLRSFHKPMSFRIEHNNGHVNLFVKMSNGKGGYGSGDLELDTFKSVDALQWNRFQSIVDSIDFWNTPHIEQTNIMGTDGAQWILEGYKNKQYHLIERWSGEEKETGPPCLFLLKLSGMKVEDIY